MTAFEEQRATCEKIAGDETITLYLCRRKEYRKPVLIKTIYDPDTGYTDIYLVKKNRMIYWTTIRTLGNQELVKENLERMTYHIIPYHQGEKHD